VSSTTPETPTRQWGLAFRPLRHRNFALIWSASLVSHIGTWTETVAVGALVAERTGQAGWTALVAAAAFLPVGVLGPVGGAVADRVDRRQFVFFTTMAQTVCAVFLAILAATDHATPIAVSAVVFVAGALSGLSFSAYQAMLPDLVPREELLEAVSLGAAQYNLGRVVGPALAAVAIALFSYTGAFVLNAISFLAMLAALAALRLAPRPPVLDDTKLWARIAVGARALAREPGVRAATTLMALVACTVSPFIALIPAMAQVRHGGGATLTSIFVTAQGVGAVGGALIVPVLVQRFGRRPFLLRSVFALGTVNVLYGLAPHPVLATVALVGMGACYIAVFSSLNTIVQLRAPAELRARMISLYFVALGALYPVGALVQGPLADRFGLTEVAVGSGLLLIAVFGIAMLKGVEGLRALDDLDVYPGPRS
jgi:MFS family permease